MFARDQPSDAYNNGLYCLGLSLGYLAMDMFETGAPRVEEAINAVIDVLQACAHGGILDWVTAVAANSAPSRIDVSTLWRAFGAGTLLDAGCAFVRTIADSTAANSRDWIEPCRRLAVLGTAVASMYGTGCTAFTTIFTVATLRAAYLMNGWLGDPTTSLKTYRARMGWLQRECACMMLDVNTGPNRTGDPLVQRFVVRNVFGAASEVLETLYLPDSTGRSITWSLASGLILIGAGALVRSWLPPTFGAGFKLLGVPTQFVRPLRIVLSQAMTIIVEEFIKNMLRS